MGTPQTALREQNDISRQIGTAARHSFVYGFGGVFIKVIGFLLLPLYTHYLSPHDYGLLEMIDLSMSLLGMFLNMGIMAALIKYYGTAESAEARRRILGTSFVFVTVTGLLVLVLGIGIIPRIPAAVSGLSIPAYYLLFPLAQFVTAYIANVPFTYLRSKEASGTVVALDGLGTLGLLLLNIVLLVGFKQGVLGMLLSPFIIGCVKFVFLMCWMWADVEFVLDWTWLRRLLAFGLPLILSSLTMFTLNFSDRFFLKHFRSLDAVGIYAVGYKFGYLLNFGLIQPFTMMWQIRMYVVAQQPNGRTVFRQIFVIYSVVLMFVGLSLAVFSPEVIAIMVDPRFASAQSVAPLIVLSYIALGIGNYFQLGMFLESRTRMIGIASAIAAAVNLAANGILIPVFGMYGAAEATLLGFTAIGIGSYYFSQRVLPLDFALPRVSKGLLLGIGVYFLSCIHMPANLAVTLAIKTALLAGYGIVVWFAIFSRDEAATLATLMAEARGSVRKLVFSKV